MPITIRRIAYQTGVVLILLAIYFAIFLFLPSYYEYSKTKMHFVPEKSVFENKKCILRQKNVILGD
ncbi:MAG TPA: hypothetical protein DD384_01360 [Firmicutes bacterium]|nr:hypothetical protein [Bacillota bacterium]